MPGPQTQHKGTVYGDDEKTPQNRDSARRCAADRSTPTGGPRAAIPFLLFFFRVLAPG